MSKTWVYVMMCKNNPVYNKTKILVTVNKKTGTMATMTPPTKTGYK